MDDTIVLTHREYAALQERAERAEARVAELEAEWEQVGWLYDEDGLYRAWRHVSEREPQSNAATPTWKPVYRRVETQNETTQ